MTKRQLLINWAKNEDWFYLSNVPYKALGMSRQTCSSALIYYCEKDVMEFRIVGLKQYRIKEQNV